jgi:hypothetical protein
VPRRGRVNGGRGRKAACGGVRRRRHRTEHLAICQAARDAPIPPHLAKQKPWKSSSFACSGPMRTTARTVAKDGCARPDASRLSLGPPDHRSCEWILAKRGFLFPVRALSVVFRAKVPRGPATGLRGAA